MDDIERKVWCILGLPFDEIDLDSTVQKIYFSAKEVAPLFISTPNINFLVACISNKKFRESVINSDLSVVDGKPIYWIAKFLDIPIPERVAGSDIIDALVQDKRSNKHLNIYFFGGEEGVAASACKKINTIKNGLHCVGHHYPGFGSVKEMSSQAIIDVINKSNPDFVIVSLGAAKGQEWIELNRGRLGAPIISHLGAVVNFISGDVTRSPKFLQTIGLEWLWRIKEEPSLWKRYYFDGASLIRLFLTKIIPYKIILLYCKRKFKNNTKLEIKNEIHDERLLLSISGIAVYDHLDELKLQLKKLNWKSKDIVINLDNTIYVDSAFLGFLLNMERLLRKTNNELLIINSTKLVKNIFKLNNCDYLLCK